MKLKNTFFATAFMFSIVAAFAGKIQFAAKSSSAFANYLSTKTSDTCTNGSGSVECNGTGADCIIEGTSYFSNTNCGTLLKKN